MISADVEGSLAADFFAPLLAAGEGVVAEALPLVAPSVCALFFFFAMAKLSCRTAVHRICVFFVAPAQLHFNKFRLGVV